MRRMRFTWPAFAAAAVVVLASMGWVTAAVLRLDAAEAESRRRAQLEENVRLALWRMDSALAPLIAAEHARPAGGFAAPLSASLPGTRTPFVAAYFRYTPDSIIPVHTSQPARAPGAPNPLPLLAPYPDLLASLPSPAAGGPVTEPGGLALAQSQLPTKGGKSQRGYQEYQARAANTMQQVEVQSNLNRSADDSADASTSPLHPVWAGDALVLARRVTAGRRESIQACLVDWPAVQTWLVTSVNDLLPGARLIPVQTPNPIAEADTRLLASLPVGLDPGPQVPMGAAGASPLRVSLLVAWACVLTAIAAVAGLLAGVASLSERRGAFVSAVTHELRTPLTTLRIYTEMLADGMVTDESQRRSYFQTLRAEADRLGHLVENVLAYSRLERNRAGYEVTSTHLGDILDRSARRLSDRAREASMELIDQIPNSVKATTVRANPLAVEQILFNIVDNTCKYAASAADRRIELSGRTTDDERCVELSVRDHGPGMPAARRGKGFRPFSKSTQEAANSAPGLGLGLAISRRLAVSMGGDLHEASAPDGGAVFTIRLRRAGPP